MDAPRRYRRRPDQPVLAVRLELDTDGFTYRKWGGEQRCKAGDWIVRNGEETYTVDAESFASTYREIAPGRYVKVAPVWARAATADGSIETKEGRTQYRSGDMLVSNREDGSDAYAMGAERFAQLYEPDL